MTTLSQPSPMVPFVHLHVHSYYSVLDGQCPLEAIIKKAKEDGMPGIALTDHGAMFGVKSFTELVQKENKPILAAQKALKKEIEKLDDGESDQAKQLKEQYEALSKQLFKPIIGCEVYCAKRSRHDKDKSAIDPYNPGRSIDASGWHLILLAKNFQGYQNLIKMVSLSYTEGEYYRPRIDKELLKKHHEGIIACSACLGGEVAQHILHDHIDRAEETIEWFKNIFGDDYYLEVQLHKTDKPNANRETYVKQLKVNEAIYDLAERLGVKVIATNDVHFVDEEDAEAHDHLICVSTKKDLDDPTRMTYSKQEWLKTTAEMNAIFQDHPEVLRHTVEVCDKVEIYSIEHGPIMPYFEIPKEFANAGAYLRYLTYEGAKERYKDNLSNEVKERIDYELEIILSMGFPDYFLIVYDFIKAARDHGVLVGPGRGSAAGSVVAYCLRITEIDPLRYGLLFERFLNPDRISLPDIDVDFEDSGRELVLDYVRQKYGVENVARIITFGQMKTKSAFNDMARVEKVPLQESNHFSKLIPREVEGVKHMTLPIAIEKTPELQTIVQQGDPKLTRAIEYATRLENTIRNVGVHACGVIISGKPVSDVVPIAQVRDKDGNDVTITQYKGEVIESTGLIKMDFLGLQTLTIIKEALENIKRRHGIDLDIDAIPLDDKKTLELYSEGKTIGTFQFESAGMRKYLIELKPDRFEDLIAMNALYRPGPMEYIPNYIDRRHGREEIVYDLPEMEEVLKETYGITVYQEQVMRLSRIIANFTRGESDVLRKGMGKKKLELLKPLEEKFFKEGQNNGHSLEVLKKIWEDWMKFAAYAFNKSHAACYAWVAYQTAYLKAHYPSEFMAGNLSCMLSKADELTKFLEECRNMEINVLSPDVNESQKKFAVNSKGDIRFGLGAIKGVSSAAIDTLIEEREKNGLFVDVYDFISRLPQGTINRKTLEGLILSGAMDSMGISREDYFAPPMHSNEEDFLAALLQYGKKMGDEKAFSQPTSLFGDIEEVQVTKPEPTKATPWSSLKKLKEERELIGLFLSGNPLDPYLLPLKYCCTTELQDLNDLNAFVGKTLSFAGMVTKTFQGTTRNNKPYGRLTIEDLTSSYEFALFGQQYLDFSNFFQEDLFLYFTGTVELNRFRNNLPELKISSISLLDDVAEKRIREVTLSIPIELLSLELSKKLIQEVKQNKGGADLVFCFNSSHSPHYSLQTPQKCKITPGTWLVLLCNKYDLSMSVK